MAIENTLRIYTRGADAPVNNIVQFRRNRKRMPNDPVVEVTSRTADAITNEDDIDRMVAMSLESGHVRDAALFVLGCNLGLRVSDIVTLRYKDLFGEDGSVRGSTTIVEQKTGNVRNLYLNQAAKIAALTMMDQRAHIDRPFSYNEYIFVSESNRKAYVGGYVKNLSRESAWRGIKAMSKRAGVSGNIATHTMRKSFGNFVAEKMPDRMRKTGDSVLLAQRIFHHSDVATTMRYIGFTNRDEIAAYHTLNLGFAPLKKYCEERGIECPNC